MRCDTVAARFALDPSLVGCDNPVMTGDALERIDRHMERGNELMDRGNKLMDRVIEEQERTRLFLRDLLVRHERATNALVRRMDAGTQELIAGRRVLEDLHEETMAQRKGILRLLDRLEGEGPPAPAN